MGAVTSLVVIWLVLAVIVGVAANTRGRNAIGWTLLAAIISPLIAGLLVLALPHHVETKHAIDDEALRQNINCAQAVGSRRRIFWFGWVVVAIIVGSVGISAWLYNPSTSTTSPTIPTVATAPIAPTTSTKPAAPAASAPDPKTDNDTQTDADKAALIKVMKDAVAARHGGVLPKTMSEEDTNVAAQAAMRWKAKQAAEKSKRELDALKVKPPPSSGYGEIAVAKEAITKMMRDPDSAVFGDVFFVNDRKSPTGYYMPVVCGAVNGKNGFGGMTDQTHFVAVMSNVASGVWMKGTTPQNVFAPQWNRYCAGRHD
jgi:hypothetical protein